MIFGAEFVMLLLLLFSFSFWLVDLARTVILLCENWLSTYMEILYTYPEILVEITIASVLQILL
jgi:hypothetical protein